MTEMKLAHIPWHVGGWLGHSQTLLERNLMESIDGLRRFDPPGHPDSTGIVVSGKLGLRPAPRPLTVVTEKNFALPADYGAEAGRIPPLPVLFPSEFLEPGEAFFHV